MRYKVKKKDCCLSIRAKAQFGETIDDMALDVFSRAYLRGFLKPKRIKKNVIEFSGPVGISLFERLKKPINRRDFLFIIEHIVVTVRKIEDNCLKKEKVILDLHYVFINEVTKELQFLYVPASRVDGAGDFTGLVESVVYSAIPASEEDGECISRFIYFLKGGKCFEADRVERFVYKEDKSVVNTIRKLNVQPSGFITDKTVEYLKHYDGGADDEPTGLLSEDDGRDEPTGLLNEYDGRDEPTGLLNEYDGRDEPTGLLNEYDGRDEPTGLLNEDEGTGLLEDDKTGYVDESDPNGSTLFRTERTVHYPTLFRLKTGETISINKCVFRLGKERSYVDFFVTNNDAVSRSHADIITRGSKCFVKDLNSKNHTFINNQRLEVQTEMEIRDGDYLKLGNEVFVFHS